MNSFKQFVISAVVALMTALGVAQATPITINVVPASAPNAFGSPSFTSWVMNNNLALLSGAPTFGNPTQPNYYSAAPSTMSVMDNVVTGFPSWQGQANPGTVFGPQFANELGNRLHFGLLVNGNGNQFSISQLGFSANSTDPGNTLSFGFGVGSYNYSTDYVGILKGVDGIVGTLDDTWITSGPNTQLVDAVVGRGSGNAWPVYMTDPGATQQDKINGVSSLFGLPSSSFNFTGTYNLYSSNTGILATGSATVTFNPANGAATVPDKGKTAVLLGMALTGLLFTHRFRQSKVQPIS